MYHHNKTSAKEMSSLQDELREFSGFAWPSYLGEEQKQRERQTRDVGKLSTVPEDTVANEYMKQLPGQPGMFFTTRTHSTIHFTLHNEGPNAPLDIKLFNPKIVQIPVVRGTTYAEVIAAVQECTAKLPRGGYQCDPAHVQGTIVMEIGDSDCEVDADSWDEVMEYLSGRSGAVAIFAYKVARLPGSQPRKGYAGRVKGTVKRAATSLLSAMRPAPRKSAPAPSHYFGGSDARWWLANPSA